MSFFGSERVTSGSFTFTFNCSGPERKKVTGIRPLEKVNKDYTIYTNNRANYVTQRNTVKLPTLERVSQRIPLEQDLI